VGCPAKISKSKFQNGHSSLSLALKCVSPHLSQDSKSASIYSFNAKSIFNCNTCFSEESLHPAHTPTTTMENALANSTLPPGRLACLWNDRRKTFFVRDVSLSVRAVQIPDQTASPPPKPKRLSMTTTFERSRYCFQEVEIAIGLLLDASPSSCHLVPTQLSLHLPEHIVAHSHRRWKKDEMT